MKVKAIVMDMDGTLLDPENKISPETLKALLDCQKKGIRLVLASGRNYGRIQPYLDQLELEKYGGLLIEINGIAIYDVQKKERHILRQLSKEEIREIFTYLMTLDVETIAVYDNGLFDYMPESILKMKQELRKTLNLPNDYPWTAGPWGWFTDMRNGYPNQKYIKEFDEIDCPINKIQVLQEEKALTKVMKNLEKTYGEKFEFFRSAPKQIEIGPLGFSKGDTLERIMKENQWTRKDILVFGDGGNDISMFKKSDFSIAMGQASDEVKKYANYVTDSNANNGIVNALKKFEVM